jgi:hypothetical protein
MLWERRGENRSACGASSAEVVTLIATERCIHATPGASGCQHAPKHTRRNSCVAQSRVAPVIAYDTGARRARQHRASGERSERSVDASEHARTLSLRSDVKTQNVAANHAGQPWRERPPWPQAWRHPPSDPVVAHATVTLRVGATDSAAGGGRHKPPSALAAAKRLTMQTLTVRR